MGVFYTYSDLKNPDGALPFIVTGTGLSSSYTNSTVFESGASHNNDFFIHAVTVNGSSITTITFRVEISYDNVSWASCISTRQDTNVSAAEHTFTLGAAPQTQTFFVNTQNTRGVFYVRLGIKSDATGSVGDTVTVNGTVG